MELISGITEKKAGLQRLKRLMAVKSPPSVRIFEKFDIGGPSALRNQLYRLLLGATRRTGVGAQIRTLRGVDRAKLSDPKAPFDFSIYAPEPARREDLMYLLKKLRRVTQQRTFNVGPPS